MAAKKSAKAVGVRFHLTKGRTHEITEEVHGKDWQDVADEYRATNGEDGHKQIVKEEPITSGEASTGEDGDAE